ncbi:MAG: ABC transporter permease [Actinomycetota bacterium]
MATRQATVSGRGASRPEWVENVGGQLLALLTALGIAVLLGAVIIVAYGENPFTVYGAILNGSFGDRNGFGYVLANAGPLIFSALAVSVCFKGGMFNIGVEGQFIVGMASASFAALTFTSLPAPLLVPIVLAFGMAGGMAWAAVPAVLKVKTGAHEVVTTIMMNGIAASFVAWVIRGPLRYEDTGGGFNVNLRTDPFPDAAMIPDLGHLFGIRPSARLSWVLPLALVVAGIIWFLFKRMRLGFEARAVGSSPGSAQAGGISIGAVQVKLFLVSGALAGLVGIQQLFADQGYLPAGYEAGIGFTGIAVAFLGQNNPVGIIFAAVLWGVLARGETSLQIETDVPREFIIILQGLLIMSVVVTYQVAKRRLFARQLRRAAAIEDLQDAEAPDDVEAAAQDDR